MSDRPTPHFDHPRWATADPAERGQLRVEYEQALISWWADQVGMELVGGRREGATRFCAECAAGGIPRGIPPRGLDSYGDCAEDGEPVNWAVPLGSSHE